MPNWCENELSIRGKSADVDEFLAAIRGEPEPMSDEAVSAHDAESATEKEAAPEVPVLSFDKIIPRPKSLDITAGSHGDIGYKAWHGTEADVERVMLYPWVQEAGIGSREELQEYLLRKDPTYKLDGDAYAANVKEHGFTNWYEWSCAKWGTKWDASDPCIVRDNHKPRRSVMIAFNTAWSPPAPVISAMVEKFPKLEFCHKCWEGGCAFRGVLRGNGGEVTFDETYDYKGHRGG
jgi:hypothetical protein